MGEVIWKSKTLKNTSSLKMGIVIFCFPPARYKMLLGEEKGWKKCSNRWWFEGDIKNYIDVIMTTMASQITSLTVVYLTVYSDADQRKHQSSASLAFVQAAQGPVTRKMFSFDDVIMACQGHQRPVDSSECVIKFNVIHINCVIITYTLQP